MKAWLIRTSGPLAGTRYPIRNAVTRVGRGPKNDILIEDDAGVSLAHFEIHASEGRYEIQDLGSTNGTYLNGIRTEKGVLEAPGSIQLGLKGPQLSFVLDDSVEFDPDQTIRMAHDPLATVHPEQEGLLAEAMAQIRLRKRRPGWEDTHALVRDALRKAVRKSSRRLRAVVVLLAVALGSVAGMAWWQIRSLRTEKEAIDKRILEIERRLQEPASAQQAEELVEQLNRYEGQAKEVSGKLLYRIAVKETVNPIEQELEKLMAEFGAETFRFPPELLEQVERFVGQYRGQNRNQIEDALGGSRKDIQTMRDIFVADQLPPDLAYMTVVESAVSKAVNPRTGAAGPWQLMAPTARGFGLVVNEKVDERLDVRRSTMAASKLIRELILDFGAGGSVMLAVAAYNVGSGKVNQAIRKVKDPIKQRDFWYLYRTRALPLETREFVPKVLAVMIIARNPRMFGFAS